MKSSVCEQYCRYYKPSKNEELACLGFLIIERLVRQGVGIPSEKKSGPLDPSVSERLLQHMCIRCPFYDDDCDFAMVSRANESGSSTSSKGRDEQQRFSPDSIPSPCGGFILLGYLLGEKGINIDDIKKLI